MKRYAGRPWKRASPPALAGAWLLSGCGAAPHSALAPKGPQAELIATLSWVMIIGAAAVLLAVTALVLVAVLRARRTPVPQPLDSKQSWRLILGGGVIVPVIVLFALLVGSVVVDRRVLAEPPASAQMIEVIGHRWWWEVHYLDEKRRRIATTANEIHIPVGQPVRFLLKSVDVIHSFWVPNLHGKTDLIPGRTNVSWLTANEPGRFRGRCAEFCGLQHARMELEVVARPPEEFAAWLRRQGEPAAPPRDARAREGEAVFLSGPCVMCHTIRGTPAGGRLGPDLTHLASRRTIGAGTLENNRGHLAGWIADSQRIKPGNAMPPISLEPDRLHALLEYLERLE